MRSIRRSLLGYLLLLLAVALGAVGVLVDRFANAAIRSREESEEDRIEQTFKVRQIEAKVKFDTDVMAETKALANVVHYKTADLLGQKLDQRQKGSGGPRPGDGPPRFLLPEPQPPARASEDEAKLFRVRMAVLGLTGPTVPPTVGPLAVLTAAFEPRIPSNGSDSRVYNDPRRYNPYPHWGDYDTARAIARVHEALHKAFDDEHGYFQLTLVAYPNRQNRTVATIRSAKLTADLPLDSAWLEQTQDLEPKTDDPDLPGLGKLHRVTTAAGVYGSPIRFYVHLPAPPPPFASVPTGLASRYPAYLPFRGPPDFVLRVYVHHARPYSELDARLAADQKDHDDQLTRVREETRAALAQLRARLVVIGSGTFAALVLGGWFIVARGLSPLRKLSDAVSKVSERDFHLSVQPAELGHELAPIHARITQTLDLLQRAFAREKQAVADISHELRTPIASLLATIDVALRKPRTPDQYRGTLEECRLISKQLGQLVERIMTLASLDAGNDNTTVARTDASELAAGCVAVIRPLAAANNIAVSAHLADELVLETDAAKLREVLMNLLHNAVEYNRPDGRIDLTVRPEGASAVFEVRDTGIGMSADVREKIFERFYRADASRTSTGVHAGLGLAIVREYVARLNGSIAIESEPGVGTTFRVTLPLVSAPAAPSAPISSDRAKVRDAVAASS